MSFGKSSPMVELQKKHPVIFNKLIKLYRLNPHGQFTDTQTRQVGLTNDELFILRDYGVFKRVQ